MNLISLTLALITSISAQSQVQCPGPFEVGSASLRAHLGSVQFKCNNLNRDTGCRYREYTVPNDKEMPGDCQLRKEPPIMDAFIRNYDCKSIQNHWNFANEMINKYNLTCEFKKKN